MEEIDKAMALKDSSNCGYFYDCRSEKLLDTATSTQLIDKTLRNWPIPKDPIYLPSFGQSLVRTHNFVQEGHFRIEKKP